MPDHDEIQIPAHPNSASDPNTPADLRSSRECISNATLDTAIDRLSAMYGVYSAIVVDIVDPDNLGRVKIRFHWDQDVAVWARIATLMGGNNRGTWFIPDVDDEVLVAFEAGDPKRPYVVGALWNGQDQPPETMDSIGVNEKKVIRSRNGVKLTLDDSDGNEQFICETPAGQKITLRDGPGEIEIDGPYGCKIKLENSGITIESNSTIKLSGSMVELAAGMFKVDAGMSRFSGVVQCDTLITNSVISASYTPGAGNIW